MTNKQQRGEDRNNNVVKTEPRPELAEATTTTNTSGPPVTCKVHSLISWFLTMVGLNKETSVRNMATGTRQFPPDIRSVSWHFPESSQTTPVHTHTHTQTHTPVQRPFFQDYPGEPVQKGKTDLDFTEARDSEWQWHQLGHMQVCTSIQTDNHASTPPLSFFTGW